MLLISSLNIYGRALNRQVQTLIEVPLPKAKYRSSRTIRADKLLSLVHSKWSLWLFVSWLQFSASACHGDDHLLFYPHGCSVMDCLACGFTEGWDLFIWWETASASCSSRMRWISDRKAWGATTPQFAEAVSSLASYLFFACQDKACPCRGAAL